MKLSKIVMISVLTAAMGISGTVYARNNGVYTPPERISCTMDPSNQLNCDVFDHTYMKEYRHTANFNQGQEQAFIFRSAAAYVGEKTRVLFTYTNYDDHDSNVTLATMDPSIQPDLAGGSWKPVGTSGELYRCDAGYKNCGITNLPSK